MKDQLPSPDFDAGRYVRPNQNWICGRECEGRGCAIGPGPGGRCRATTECTPVLELKEGQTKGRYKCTRPAEQGGPCADGPLPDGCCCRKIPRCQPVRSLRSKRKIFTITTIMATVTFLLLALGGQYRWKFVSPGKLSSNHASAAFWGAYARLHAEAKPGDPGCAGCHATAQGGPGRWVKSAINSDPGLFRVRTLALTTTADMTSIDQSCEVCHTAHTFHEPNVVKDHSCSACHREHEGNGLMRPPEDSNCMACHGDADVMAASREKGNHLAAAAFAFRPANGRQVFQAPRPKDGFTAVIHSFAVDHPEFQVLRDKLPDPDTLKFNHQLHLTSPTVPQINGRGLECADCHKPDAAGIFKQKISFEESCRKCHSLQFDAQNADLTLPHGQPEFVRAFLRSLPAQYAEYGARRKGLTAQADIDAFVKQQMAQIREQTLSGENLEREVFFSDAKLGPAAQVGHLGERGRARFPGCVYCHEVKPVENAAPVVTPPAIMDRWLVRGGFNHSKHLMVECAKCHSVTASARTSDVLLPSKATCAECHSPKGGVASGCSLCHGYHAPANAVTAELK